MHYKSIVLENDARKQKPVIVCRHEMDISRIRKRSSEYLLISLPRYGYMCICTVYFEFLYYVKKWIRRKYLHNGHEPFYSFWIVV